MLFYFIRHGEPDYATDTLTPLGVRQAEAVARRLSVHGIDRIYSSPLGRARQTAQPTAELQRLSVEIEDWTSESLAWKDFSEKREDGRTHWVFDRPDTEVLNADSMRYTNGNWYTLPAFANINAKAGYERIQRASDDFFARQGYVREGAKYRIERPNNDRVALFAHAGFGFVFLSALLQIPPQFFFTLFDFTHAGISIFHFENNPDGYSMPRCLSFNDTAFLYEDRLPLRYNGGLKL